MRYCLQFLASVDLAKSHNYSTGSNGDRLSSATISSGLRIREIGKAILLSIAFLLFSMTSVSLSAAGEPPVPDMVSASDGEFLDIVRINWVDVTDETSYQVFRCGSDDTGTCGEAIGTLDEDTIQYDDINAEIVGGVHHYRLKSCNINGCSLFSVADTGYTQLISKNSLEDDEVSITGYTANDASHVSLSLPLSGPVNLNWSTSGAATCVASSSPILDDWNPAVTISTYGPKTVQLPEVAQSYVLDLGCESDSGPEVNRQVTVTVSTVPDAPTLTSAAVLDRSALLTFSANGSGNSAITGYTAKCDAFDQDGVSSPITVDGLTNGIEYSCSVIATNANGNSLSSNVIPVTPATVPDAPILVTAAAGDGSALLTFTANGNGGSSITDYTAKCGGFSKTGATSPITVSGLTNGVQYSCSVIATNAIGNSLVSNDKSVTPVTVPDAPTLVTAAAGDSSALLTFTANGNGGSSITGYTAECGTFSKTGGGSPLEVVGLTNGTQYSCSVFASNAIGNSVSSNVLLVTPVVQTVVSILNFEVTTDKDPQPVSCGDTNITFTWATENANACYGSWKESPDNPEGLLSTLNNTKTVLFEDLAGDKEFTLRCTDAQIEVSQSKIVTTVAPCLHTETRSWVNVFTIDWPGPTSFTTSDRIANSTNLAIKFNTGAVIHKTEAASPITLSGMMNGAPYSCSVVATNEFGSSVPSNVRFVTPVPPADFATSNAEEDRALSNNFSETSIESATVPPAPYLQSAVQGDNGATLSFDPLGDGGSAITSYTASCRISTFGGLGTIEYGNTRGDRLLAISRKPGDFQVADECKQYQALSDFLIWESEGSNEYPEACKLESNTTYYWNITFTDGINIGSSRCAGTPCLTWIRVANPEFVN